MRAISRNGSETPRSTADGTERTEELIVAIAPAPACDLPSERRPATDMPDPVQAGARHMVSRPEDVIVKVALDLAAACDTTA